MQARYQYGNLTLRKRKKGPDVWQFRWMENGRLKSALIGTVDRYPNQADAERAVEHLRIKINAENPQQQFHHVIVGALIDRFMEEYTPKHCRENTRKNYLSLFKNHIRPKWGGELVQNVKTMAIENWLETYPANQKAPQMTDHLAVVRTKAGGELPALVDRAGERAARRFLEFFTVNIRNRNTRAA